MSKTIITQEAERSKKLNEYLQGLKNLYKDDLEKVIYLCYELGGTQEQIGEALGISKQLVSQQYPKSKEKQNGK